MKKEMDDNKEKPSKHYIGSTVYSDIVRARANERNRLHEIDIIDKDLELIENLTLEEIETIWYLRHMPEALAKYNRLRIKKDFDSVSNFLEVYDYIKV